MVPLAVVGPWLFASLVLAGVVEVDLPRPAVAVILLAEPSSELAPVVARELDGALGTRTSLALAWLPEALAIDCEGDLGCMSSRAGAEIARLAAVVVIALPRSKDGTPLASAACAAPRAPEAPLTLPIRGLAAPDVPAFVEEVLGQLARLPGLRPDLARPGTLRLRGLAPGDRISVDGEPVSSPDAATLDVRRVPAGPRSVEVRRGPETLRAEALVTAGDTTELPFFPARTFDHPRSTWTALAVTAAGVGLVAYGLARAAGEPDGRCLDGAVERCGGPIRLTYDPTSPFEPGSGPLIGPLGGALALGGGVAALGAEVFVEPEEAPWLPWLLGLGAAAVVYGTAELVTAGAAP